MELDFFETDTLAQELEKLPPLYRLAFAASICERLLPNYYAYHRTEEWETGEPPNPDDLRKILDRIWLVINGEILEAKDVDVLGGICEGMLKDGDSALSVHYTDGIHTINAICNTLKACLEPTPKNIIEVVNDVTLTIADFIYLEEESIDPSWSDRPQEDIDEELNNHPFTVRERGKQREDLQRLKEIETLDQEFLEWLRTSFENGGRSLIDVS